VIFLQNRGIEVAVLDPAHSAAAADCVKLAARFRREKPDLWLEDWGGGPNSATGTNDSTEKSPALPIC